MFTVALFAAALGKGGVSEHSSGDDKRGSGGAKTLR
jgi:uncharacterized membrane protein YtjA (UPF0391 family)